MHIYNWYHSITTGIHYIHKHRLQCTCAFPLLYSPCWPPLLPFLIVLYLLGTLLAVTGSVHLGLRLLETDLPFLNPFPNPSPLQIPRTQVIKRLTKTTLRIQHLLSGTLLTFECRRDHFQLCKQCYWLTSVCQRLLATVTSSIDFWA
jgi:hypothetical protein